MSYNPDKKYTEEEMQLALRQFINGTFNLNVPAQDTDADLVLARSITELTALRSWKEKARPRLRLAESMLKTQLLEMKNNGGNDSDHYENDVYLAVKSELNELTELLKEGE